MVEPGPIDPLLLYFEFKATEAVQQAALQKPRVEQEAVSIMDRYDMTPEIPVFTWKDIVRTPFVLAVAGATYLRYRLTEKLFRE